MLTDPNLEQSVVGWALIAPADTGALLDVLRPADLSSPILAAVLEAIESLHRDGKKWDARIIHRIAQERAGLPIDPSVITDCTAAATHAWRTGVIRLTEMRARRDLLAVAGRLEALVNAGTDPSVVIDTVSTELAGIETVGEELPPNLLVSAAVAAEDHEAAPWVVPGLLRRQHRAVIVGFEGDGKSTLLAQIGWAASQGIHPFRRTLHDPQVVVHVDLENPRDRIGLGYRPIVAACKQTRAAFDDSRHFTLHRDDGMDLRTRRDRAQLERVLHSLRPDLMCIGPLRKTYRRGARESEEDRALEVQSILDDLRSRFDCALLMEHHAPHADGIGKRNPRPFGSSTWLGWPEFGLGMDPETDDRGKPVPGMFHLARWRADRVAADWPQQITRGRVWPFDSPDQGDRSHP